MIGPYCHYKTFTDWIKKNPDSQLHLNGWFHDNNRPINSSELIQEFDEFTKNKIIDFLIIDSLELNKTLFDTSVKWAEGKGARIRLIQNTPDILDGKLFKENKFGPFISVPIRREPMALKPNQLLKKTLDVIISTLVLITLYWWFYPLIGILIKLSNKGPIIIYQERIGIDGRKFNCMKFRTMIQSDTTNDKTSYFTKKNDKRVTLIGKILRETNLDELPQFINVLKGEMSVVGPRPHMVNEDEEIADKILNYRIRRFAKPGITGLAAVKGYRGGTKDLKLLQKRINYDIHYIENWSLLLDIKIALITIWKMITFNTNAH